MKNKNNIILVGFMGTGKSTIARKLAQHLNWTLVDTDQLIESSMNMSVNEIFQKKGENYFRAIESKAIADTLQAEKQVVSTGGGAVLLEKNREIMLDNGLVVTLKADLQTIIQRVEKDRNRPLIKGDIHFNVKALLEKRKYAYDFAPIHIDTSITSVGDTITQIAQYLEK